ncbi:MAG: succinyl-CoA synthetase subunit alpha [Deltaproteobacteria bacterium ADurb.Bin151]|nr:GNAT family N-acetyltransferase [Smithella sp.]OQB54102.1 MAG: succinyl-CoA synthetase subunit alpha [Deltaproteobacteria bacterium ADurb.Bin151]HNZ11679.1 GNAT family N-acetyltransferase [Smithellaceae bacterium]HOG82408.1 GNAT family N-acetyltransferase [Smithellaceae bacterium]HOQ41481.1 GNAT family N-acetyltransferase [Smithellaceae bacterium]
MAKQTFSAVKQEKPRAAVKGQESSNQHQKILKDELAEVIHQAVRDNRSYLMEHESKEILEGIGIATTGYLVARSEDEALAFCDKIGFPVVLKIVSPDVVHKTDAGGVKLNLMNAADVRKAYRDILETFKYQHIEGVAVQRMAPSGIEAIIGVARDPGFGPVIMFGLGGVFVEVLRDVSFRILPITEKDATEMIEDIRSSDILKGYRGKAVDLDSLKQLLLKISRLVVENPEISELDLNPLILYPDGYVTVDARMFVSEPTQQDNVTAGGMENLHDFFYPQSIAVIGASDVQGKLGYNVFSNLIHHHFAGKLYPINPGKESIMGVPAYKTILDVQEPVDLAIIIVPAKRVEAAIADCCKKGVKFVVVEAAGFAESGEEGKESQARIERIIREHGCRVLGPNCSGVINTHHNMVQSIGLLSDLRKGNVGMVAQAGVYAAGILTGLSHVLDFGIVATIGNKMDINETDILEHLSNDEHISVIVMYMEDIRSGKRFVNVASRAAVRKPVIVLKSGRTEAGKKAVSSHTASLAGNDEVNNAAFKQSGLIRARDNEHLFALTRAFSKQPIPKDKGVMVITYTGSLGVAATDMLYLSNMRLATLEPYFQKRIKSVLPDYASISNPIDCSFTMSPEQVKSLIEIGVECGDVNSFIVVIQGEILGSFVEAMKSINYKGKPVVCVVACKEFMIHDVVKMEQAGFPVYSTAEMAAEVLGQMYHYGVRRRNAIADSIARNLTRDALSVDDNPVQLRLINQKDINLWTDFVNSCSEKSLWLRFLSPFSATPERAQRFCNIDPDEEVAVVAEMKTNDQHKFLGIARLIKNKRCEGEAEYAIIISDPWQNKSLGITLSKQCIELAKKEGYRTIRAETLQENYAMIRIFRRCDFNLDTKDENMVSMSLNLS